MGAPPSTGYRLKEVGPSRSKSVRDEICGIQRNLGSSVMPKLVILGTKGITQLLRYEFEIRIYIYQSRLSAISFSIDKIASDNLSSPIIALTYVLISLSFEKLRCPDLILTGIIVKRIHCYTLQRFTNNIYLK